MTALDPPATLFGVPLALTRADGDALIATLRALWQAQCGQLPGELDSDVEMLARWWHPKLRGSTVRQRLAELPPAGVDLRTSFLTDELVVRIDEVRGLVTVEGRLVYQALMEAPSSAGSIVISPSTVAAVSNRAATLNSRWAQFRLRDVATLLRGEGAVLLPPVAALLVLLLVNRSTAPARGLAIPDDKSQVRDVDEALQGALLEFASIIRETARGRDPRHFSLYGGYLLSEASRRLGSDLVRSGGRVFIAEGREAAVLDLLGRDLARRNDITEDVLSRAIDVLVSRIRGPVGRLALHGSAHEQPANTARVTQELLAAFRQYREVRDDG